MSAARIPEHGRSADELLAEIDSLRTGDLDWRGGRAFSLVYHPGDEEHEALLEAVVRRYAHDNALNPFKYPSLLQMELDVIAMAADLFGAAPEAGSLTSGGTESLFLAVQVARDHAREERGIDEPQVVVPSTAHPAIAKACRYLDVERVVVPVGADGRADVAATRAALTERSALLVASAPCYPYGVIDPITELAALAAEAGALCHVDACVGGWLLPWWARLGERVPPWDLRVPGVTSLSADVHKYGYTVKGASVVCYADAALRRRQVFWFEDWPGGLYASGTTAGTRPAGPIAAAWTALMHLGQDGFVRLAAQVRDTARRLCAGIEAIDGLYLTHRPDLSLIEFAARPDSAIDLGAVADAMDARGWNLDRQPGGLHLMVSPYHARIAEPFLADLSEAVAAGGASRGVRPTYGGVAEH